ncbi:unnamed protein product [Adineta ricciae]|uniref:Uncharacterized protein n=2 Tax=Adineta ricciae TaxID=249248 RepID=A0A815XM16_ADIRI|nr:unnamed protein product [Adineta ricciae]
MDIRKLSNGPCPSRPVHQHAHFCVRTFHLLLTHPVYSLFFLLIIYLQLMDLILYVKIRSRGPLDFDATTANKTHSDFINQNSNSIQIFSSLPVKKIMVGQTTQFIREPLAECLESKLFFTYYFPMISANAVSFFHCFLSLISIKFFSSESLFRRQIGVVIFQIRSFLDCLDGVVFRAHMKNQRYKSYYGDIGYYVDALSDVLGGVCLIVGCLLYFFKQRPVIRSKSRQPLPASTRSSPTLDIGSEESELMILNLEDEQKETNSIISESKGKIVLVLSIFSLRYSLSALFWDRSVRFYEDLLDSYTNKPQQQALQLTLLHSPLTILIFYLWRYLSAISMQDFLLFAIFFDRTWISLILMENQDLTFWKNYQAGMTWIKGNQTMEVSGEQEEQMNDDEELEFMIDDDLLDFYRLSRDHKLDRKNRRTQEKNEAEQIDLIPGEQMRPNTQSISKLPPINRSKLRQLELEWLYGSNNSSKIHARETQLQMEFDRIFDQKQPSYFPSLPNRLQLNPHVHGQRTIFAIVPILDTES